MQSFRIITPEASPFTIGRKSDCNLVLANPMVSRYHAVLEKDAEGAWTLTSLSENSITKINGMDFPTSAKHTLTDGDIILVGPMQIRATFKGDSLSLLLMESVDADFAKTYPLTEAWTNIDNFTIHLKDRSAEIKFRQKLVTCEGKRIREATIQEGETIQLPSTELTLEGETLVERNRPQGFSVSAHNLDIFAGKKQIVQGLNFTLPTGEILAIIGRSGQGKSTLLRLLQGVHRCGTDSHVLIGGIDYRNAEIRKHIAFLEQDPELRRDLTVRETLMDGARVSMSRKEFKDNANSRMEQFCELFGLTGRMENQVKTLSGGELRRVALARELMGNPGLIVLDEPLSGLDPYNAKILCNHLKQLSFLGHTVILTTHSYEALDIADKVLVLHQGEQAFYGSPKGAYQFFKTTDPENILSHLNDESATTWENSWESKSQINEAEMADEENAKHAQQSILFLESNLSPVFLYKIGLTLKQWIRDRGKALTLLLQPLIIGFLFSLIFSNLTSLWIVAFAVILSANWLALSLSIREIVSEREILCSEFRKGVPIFPTVLSKIALPTLIAWIQTLIVFAFVAVRISAHSNIFALLLASLTAVLPAVTVGLTVSAFAKNSGQANATLPLLIIPQVALAGALVPLDQMQPIGRALSYVIWSRYNQNSLLNLLLERNDAPANSIAAIAIAIGFYIVITIKLYKSKNAK